MATAFERAHPLSIGAEFEFMLIFPKSLLRSVLVEGESVVTNGRDDNGNKLDRFSFASGWAIREEAHSKLPTFRMYRDERQKMAMYMLEAEDEDGEEMEISDASDEQSAASDNDEENTTDKKHQLVGDTTRIDSVVTSDASLGSSRTHATSDLVKDVFKTRLGWFLKRDLSIRQLSKNQKAQLGIVPVNEVDTIELELISTPYGFTESADTGLPQLLHQASAYFSRLGSSDCHIGVKKDCGLHLHFGCLDGSRLPIRALRITTFILLIYEHELSRLHPPHRVALKSGPHIRSNLSQYKASDVGEFEYQVDEAGKKWVRSKYVSIEWLRDSLLNGGDEDDSDAEAEYEVVKSKGSYARDFFYNFRNADGWNLKGGVRKRRPPTIEFRQPAATFDSERVGMLARLYGAIIRFALQLAETTTTMDDVLPDVRDWSTKIIELENLVEMLNLPEDTANQLVSYARPREGGDWGLLWETCNEYGEVEEEQDIPEMSDDDLEEVLVDEHGLGPDDIQSKLAAELVWEKYAG